MRVHLHAHVPVRVHRPLRDVLAVVAPHEMVEWVAAAAGAATRVRMRGCEDSVVIKPEWAGVDGRGCERVRASAYGFASMKTHTRTRILREHTVAARRRVDVSPSSTWSDLICEMPLRDRGT